MGLQRVGGTRLSNWTNLQMSMWWITLKISLYTWKNTNDFRQWEWHRGKAFLMNSLPLSEGKKCEFEILMEYSEITWRKSLWLCRSQHTVENLKKMGIADHLTYLLRNLYAGQEATVRTGHRTDWFQIGKGVCQACILSPCLFNLYAEYIMRNAGLNEA